MQAKIFLLFLIISFSSIFAKVDPIDPSLVTKQDLQEFLDVYAQRPIQDNSGGMKSIGCFWVWYVVKKINEVTPIDLIVESGIWLGQSTWLLEQAAPNAKIVSIDPNLTRIQYRNSNVFYTTEDFSTIDFGPLDGLTTLCFFDDHINAYARVMQAYQKGFTYLLFDDNYPPEWNGDHYSLAQCLANDNFLSNQLKNIMQDYVILPHICAYRYRRGNKKFDLECLNIPLEPELEVFKQDAHTYRWTTFVTLKPIIKK